MHQQERMNGVACLIATASSHPQRRGLPVVVPNSWPIFLISSPTSFFNSVGKGPAPTLYFACQVRKNCGNQTQILCDELHLSVTTIYLVVYAFMMPITPSILLGAKPKPVTAPSRNKVNSSSKDIFKGKKK